jgi:transcriptional regulator with XRE-family HTH domain
MEKFGSWLLNELASRNMSQSDLARACEITTAQMSRIISGERNAGKGTLTEIAHALKLPVDLVYEKAGLLPPKLELSPIKRKLAHLAEKLPDSDLEMVIALLEQRDEFYKKNPQAKPTK